MIFSIRTTDHRWWLYRYRADTVFRSWW